MKSVFILYSILILLSSGSALYHVDQAIPSSTWSDIKKTFSRPEKKNFKKYYQVKLTKTLNNKKQLKNDQRDLTENQEGTTDSVSGKNSKLQVFFEDSGLDPIHFNQWIESDLLNGVHLNSHGKTTKFKKATVLVSNSKILYLSDSQFIDTIRVDRNEEFNNNSSSDSEGPDEDSEEAEEKKLSRISQRRYGFVKFKPGLTDDGELIAKPRNFRKSLKGPDHHFEYIDPKDIDALQELREKTISLGHGGEIIIQVDCEDCYIFDKDGPDFVIFENPFKIAGTSIFYQEFAKVGVALENKPESFTWFPCSPGNSQLLTCAGVVPTLEGGDMFDLASIGVKKIKYIKIIDTGTNMSNFSKNSEGFDLDALSLLNAYHEEKIEEEKEEVE